MIGTPFLRRSRSSAHFPVWAAILLGCPTVRALEFEKVLAFATADSVRIEVAPRAGDDFSRVVFQGAITRSGNGQLLWQGVLGQSAPGASKGALFTRTISMLNREPIKS